MARGILPHNRLAARFSSGEGEGESAGAGLGGEAEGGAVVDDPVGARGKKCVVVNCGAHGKDTGARGFAGTNAEGRVFNDDTGLRVEMKRLGAFEVRLRIGLAALDIGGSDEVMDVRPKIGGAQTDFGKRASGGSDDRELRRRHSGEQLLGAGKRDDVSNFLNFATLHPAIFFQVNCRIGVGQEFADGGETGTAVGEVHDVVGIEIVLESPAGPDAGDGRGGVNKDAVHVDQQGFAGDVSHENIVVDEILGGTINRIYRNAESSMIDKVWGGR